MNTKNITAALALALALGAAAPALADNSVRFPGLEIEQLTEQLQQQQLQSEDRRQPQASEAPTFG